MNAEEIERIRLSIYLLGNTTLTHRDSKNKVTGNRKTKKFHAALDHVKPKLWRALGITWIHLLANLLANFSRDSFLI